MTSELDGRSRRASASLFLGPMVASAVRLSVVNCLFALIL